MTAPQPADRPDGQVVEAVFGAYAAEAAAYAEILATRGVEWGLVGPREIDRIWGRHVLNSAAMAALVPHGADVVDVGSGAGLPGIPLALARPDLTVTLLEPLERRDEFLRLAVAELGLDDRVQCRRGRAEAVSDRTWRVVTARAVAPLDRLVRWTAPLLSPTGQILALKGESAPAEVEKARHTLRKARLHAEVLVVRAHPTTDDTRVVRLRRS